MIRRFAPTHSTHRFWTILLGLLMTSCAMQRAEMASRAIAWERPAPVWPMVGVASWYSEQDPGVQPQTASGELFRDTDLTAAAWGLPLESCLLVTNLNTLQRVAVRVNDRGPHQRLLRQGRVIDLSRAAFARVADLNDGLIPVQVDPAPCS